MKKKAIEDNLVIRPCGQADTSTIFTLIQRLALDQKKVGAFTAKPENFKSIFNNPSLRINAIMAEYHERAIGICLYFFSYSTWRGETGLYIQDLFVDENYRRNNVAKKLVSKAALDGSNVGAAFIRLAVSNSNNEAQRFYSSLGLTAASHETIYTAYDLAFQRIKD